MSLNLSHEERTEMLSRWFDGIVGGYPEETEQFLRDQADPFANPVGAGLRDELAPILDAILAGTDPAEAAPSLDRIIRVRALQEMTPAEAVSFVLDLKELYRAVTDAASETACTEFDHRVDAMLLTAFDVYSRCREQVFDIRVKEIRNRSLKAMEKLNSWREKRAGHPSPTREN